MSIVHSIGIMTGTSCDGADAALISIENSRGSIHETLKATYSRKFPTALRKRLKKAQTGKLNIRDTAILCRDYSRWIASLCEDFLRKTRTSRSRTILSIHGQTVWHEPESQITIQMLDPSIIAEHTGCTVVSSFRQSDVAAGGQGAPLVPLYHRLLMKQLDRSVKAPVAMHNVGGIANLTCVDVNGNVFAFDTGPANVLIDLAVERYSRGKQLFDRNGRIAASAIKQIDWALVDRILMHRYFLKRPPKSTGRELFNEKFLNRFKKSGPALIANATALSAASMALGYGLAKRHFGVPLPKTVFFCGGGAKNETLLRLFEKEFYRRLGQHVTAKAIPDHVAPSGYVEAMAFARLGYEVIAGKPIALATVTGAKKDSIGASVFTTKNSRSLLKLK